jgi:hypothetical protein
VRVFSLGYVERICLVAVAPVVVVVPLDLAPAAEGLGMSAGHRAKPTVA